MVQEKQIWIYRYSLIIGVGDGRKKKFKNLIRLYNESVTNKKISCTTQLQLYLAIANLANGEDLFREVCFLSLVLLIILTLILMVHYTYCVFPWFR